jgi:putative two-component system response regulator
LDEAALKSAKILIVDDQEQNVLLLEHLLEQAGYTNLKSTTDSSQVVGLCSAMSPDLILLDLHMPDPDGFEVMRLLSPWIEGRWFPILVLTADITPEAKAKALSNGARDFVTKPFDRAEVLLRIRNMLEVRFLQLELRKQNLVLEQRVYERTKALDEARFEMLDRLALAAEFRDDDTRQHTQRVGRTSALIARVLGMDEERVELIRLAAPLHDIGKIGVSDLILQKPGKLTAEEFELMKDHVTIGTSVLSGSRSPILQLAAKIALSHHEWWDGTGYPSGLSGAETPIVGRIVAVADVFDALTHNRPYKRAWAVDAALEELYTLSGQQFDPLVIEAFERLDHEKLLAPVEVSARPVPSRESSMAEAAR